jgi:hypothetical protein
MNFQPAKEKLTIISKDKPDKDHTVRAQYNPSQLQVDQNVPWKKPEAATQTGTQKAKKGDEDPIALEFTGAEGRSMTVELLFDGYEEAQEGAAKSKGEPRVVDVKGQVAILEKLASVIDPTSKLEKLRRPHQCMVSWGAEGLPSFLCVIESLSTKYTMFSNLGKPLRATCTVKLKEAHAVEKKPPAPAKGKK